jgi:hypothetical protein
MDTGIDRLICEWWSQTAALSALVPADRVASEIIQQSEDLAEDDDADGVFDDCVVFDITTEPHWRTNSARGYQSAITLAAMSADYIRSEAVAQQIIRSWADQSFSSEAISVTDCRPDGIMERSQDEQTGLWQHSVTLRMNHVGVG